MAGSQSFTATLVATSFLLSATISSSSTAFAGHTIVQDVVSDYDGVKLERTHTWMIADDKFRLEVTSALGETFYVFNGRTFYVCSRMEKQQIEYLSANAIKDSDLLDKFRKGACQSVPSNFLTRFFISPSDAVESIDRTDGLKLSLAINSFASAKTAKSQTINSVSCDRVDRSYVMTKSQVGDSASAFTTDTKDSLCLASAISWRKELWREVSKAALRQSGAAVLLKTLKEENGGPAGFPLAGEYHLTRTLADGKKSTGKRTVTTKSIKESPVAASVFAVPADYAIFSPESLVKEFQALQVQTTARAKPAGGEAKGEDEQTGKAAELGSVLFCALSGSFACIGNVLK